MGLDAAATHFAVHDDLILAVLCLHPRRELAEGNEFRAEGFEIANLPFVRVTHIDERQRFAAIQLLLETADRDFPARRLCCLLRNGVTPPNCSSTCDMESPLLNAHPCSPCPCYMLARFLNC